ncbi:MarR family transcriptional regulator [Gordonia sp. HY285]|uniref:MarR family winged helix-turn-helix transcriptional regulator n=1 Tax=Gordonia liuliyuniae TaxID=2911517 RepID=UPI001F023EFF|nr:MarR family transcriptional regulator [Gordonia liuliyuniae]MCF8611548.1 MarR family transcriptional regulator [Gordonia liuliyuniae]
MTAAADRRPAAWRLFIESSVRVQTAVDERLRASDGMTLSDYHVLLLLSEAPGHRMRMRSLADRMVFSASRLTYQIGALVKRGWVCREPVPEDGRGAFACLTAAGFDAFTAAARRHGLDVDELFFAGLTPDDGSALEAVLTRLAAHLDATRLDSPGEQ